MGRRGVDTVPGQHRRGGRVGRRAYGRAKHPPIRSGVPQRGGGCCRPYIMLRYCGGAAAPTPVIPRPGNIAVLRWWSPGVRAGEAPADTVGRAAARWRVLSPLHHVALLRRGGHPNIHHPARRRGIHTAAGRCRNVAAM